ncbi:Sec7 domain protein [Aspergillus lucknowensis]|uniref:SEC7 domain-containing protein n=1 Tax=Aspergillus lucknowensis TaxID=176173 RepID=A0ABR4LEH4_9EURO
MSRPMRSGSLRSTSQYTGFDTHNSPPRTPPGPSSYKIKRGRHPRPSVRETFLYDYTPADNANDSYDSGDERDPHDLSLSPKHAARTSVVDNMLLSLDQFSSGPSVLDDYHLFNSAFESDRYTQASQESIRQRKYRGHTLSSSVSSDVEYGYDDGASRYTAQHARERRSNSSSNHHSGLRRYESARSRDGTGSRGQTFDYRTSATAPGTRAGRKSSKGSTSSNLDFGPPLSRRQAEPTSERRSASFDLGTRKPFTTFPGSTSDYDPLAYDGLDAAPTPSVPAGPRKYQTASHGDFALRAQSSRTPVASRRSSVKSSRTTQTRKSRPDNLGTAAMRPRELDFALLSDSDLDAPPNISASLDPPAPSPTISFNKPAFPLPPPEPTPVKERPGFFRRVFGSSRSPTAMPAESSPSNASKPKQPETKDTNGASPTVQGRIHPPKTSSSSTHPTREGAQVVNKKSSFFRRRKKSVVENIPPPIALPPNLKAVSVMKPEPSPVSSLRKVMDPYLADASPNTSTPAVDYSTESSDWSTAANDPDNKKPEDLSRKAKGNSSNFLTGPKAKYSLYPASSTHALDTSFLGTSSGDEESVVKSNGLDTTPLATQRQERTETRDGVQAEESDSKTDGAQQDADLSRNTLLAMGNMRATSLSPVAERSSQKSAVLPIENPEEKSTLLPTTEFGEREIYDATIWNDDSDAPSKLSTPIIGKGSPRASVSEASNYHTAANTPIIPQGWNAAGSNNEPSGEALNESPSDEDKEQAQKLYDGQDEFVGNELAAAWLGAPDRVKIRAAYMELFDWSNMNILAALRSLCMRLVLKGETQQVDRVLDAFSTRWCQCNPRHGFKAADVVHTICYSLLLLNTDLHLADIEQKMTKAQFVRNTIPTIQRVAIDAAPEEAGNKVKGSNIDLGLQSSRSATFPADESESNNANTDKPDKPVNTPGKLVNRLSRTDLSSKMASDAVNEVGPLVNTPFHGTMKAWEQQVETVLRDFYTSIQKQRLPLHGAQSDAEVPRTASSAMLGPAPHGLRRSPSTVSKSGSDIFPRGRSADSRYGAARWSSKPRSRARLYPPSTLGSSRTSLDDQSSLWSPSGSSTWSKYSLGKLTSASVDSFGSGYPQADYQQSIGFANALSQAIIREDSAQSIASTEDPERTGQLLEDETLALAGAPWAKEGSLKHKHHLDSIDKRAKDRNWNECFAVIQQGWMRLFSFNASKSVRQKAKPRHAGGVVVGGGNWTENAEETWKFLLRQSIASALPPPGYSKSRPHVWALSLPTGAVHLFQAGTPEIVREFVSSANYWSARLSKEPLIGGISNIEYGWSDAIINSALINPDANRSPPSSSGARPSIQSSIRSSIDQQVVRPKLPADRVNISDWNPPQQSMIATSLGEADQLKGLQNYVKNVEAELQRHNELRAAMVLAFSPRHPNGTKAMANWERKSSYLLREIVKFRTYIDSLQSAIDAKNKIYEAREEDNKASES